MAAMIGEKDGAGMTWPSRAITQPATDAEQGGGSGSRDGYHGQWRRLRARVLRQCCRPLPTGILARLTPVCPMVPPNRFPNGEDAERMLPGCLRAGKG